MLYLYGLIETRPLPSRRGLGDGELARVEVGELAAVVSEIDQRPTASEDALWEHESVLEALMIDGPVLPVRFGVVFADVEDVERELRTRHDAFAAALETVRGKVEIGVRVLKAPAVDERPAAADDGDSRPGTRYLRERLARRSEAALLARPIQDALAPFAVAERVRVRPEPNTLLSASYLVAASELDAVRTQVAELQRANAELNLVCTGPWPPYNFVDAGGSTD